MGFLPRPIDLINKTVGLAGVKLARGLGYGQDRRQRLDVYGPKRLSENLPVVVFFYGGSWQSGDRADYAFVAALLVRQGFVVVVPDYRLYPQVKFPDFMEDSAAATAWVFNNIAAHGGDPDTIFLMGHSAGAYNAVLLALARIFLQETGIDAGRIAGVIGLAGPYDFLPLQDPALKAIFSPPVDIRHTQPITFARGDAAPLFLATGGADSKVKPRNTAALAARLRELGGTVETKVYPSLGHIGIILSLLPALGWRAPVMKDVLAFCAACRAGEFSPLHAEVPSRMVGERK
jgi:acetyl esterase/lipase